MPHAKRSEEPMDRLTRICDVMTEALEAHPEYNEATDKAVVLIDDDAQGGAVRHGYANGPEGDMGVAQVLLAHAQALHEVNGLPFSVAHVPFGRG
jgi:hypothetical protein